MRKIVGIASASLVALGSVLVGAASASAAPRPQRPAPAVVQIQSIQYDAPGRDTRTNQSLNGEFVTLVNHGRRAVNLNGYEVSDRANHVYRFGNVWLEGRGGTVRLHTGNGRNTSRDVYWRSGNHIWNNDGDTAVLSGPRGRTIDSCSYRERNVRDGRDGGRDGRDGRGPRDRDGLGRVAC
ncbi:lamin tail domain-containing protein [Asanoa sp. NPDC049518]|uniref:lamin tail domain-containing protein n=1 Tax=unclassified Asanoa TaxID=2685164 RepID=UPI003431D4D7